LATFIKQAQRCTLTSRAFFNDQFPVFAKYITSCFGYDMVLPMNTGAEAVETALKIARKWGYQKACRNPSPLRPMLARSLAHLGGCWPEQKGIAKNEALVVSCNECFHGRTIGVISMSTDPSAYEGFGPMLPGHLKVPFNDVPALQKLFEQHGSRICGFLVEPIQGEAGYILLLYHSSILLPLRRSRSVRQRVTGARAREQCDCAGRGVPARLLRSLQEIQYSVHGR
jgi:ornithine--oxo-acid transaminase